MANDVVLQQVDPLTAAASAVGDYQTRQRQSDLDTQAQRNAQGQLGIQQGTLDETKAQDAIGNRQADQAALLAAKKEADAELDRARKDAVDQAKADNARRKDDQAFQLALKKLSTAYAIAKMNNQRAVTVADVHANATTGSAQIHAAATVQSAGIHADATVDSAGIHAAATDRGQDLSHADRVAGRGVTKRGQDLAHQDRVGARTSANDRAEAARIATAVNSLRKTKGAPPVPTDDPKFNEAFDIFTHASPAERDATINDPRVPPSTKAYLQALAPILLHVGQ